MSGDTINSDLIRGNIDTIILRALYEGDRYGYDILKEIEQRSKGKYQLKQPTLYSSLKRLETQGFIKSYWGAKSIGGRRKYFTLTDRGKEVFVHNKADWEYSRTLIDALISMGDDPLSSSVKNYDSYSETEGYGDEEFSEEELNLSDESNAAQDENSENRSDASPDDRYCDAVVFIDDKQHYDDEEDEVSETKPEDSQTQESESEDASYCDAVVFVDDKQHYDDEEDEVSETKPEDSQTQDSESEDASYCDAVVFVDDKQHYDDEDPEEIQPSYELDNSDNDKDIDLMYSSDYSEKESYIGTMRDKTYNPETVDMSFADMNSNIDDELDIDDEDIFDDDDESYSEEKNAQPYTPPPQDIFAKAEPQKPETYKPEFYSYHSDVGHIENVVLPESDGKSLLDKLDEKAKTMSHYTPPPSPPPQPQPIQQPQQEEPKPMPEPLGEYDLSDFNLGHNVQIRKFDSVIQKGADYGNDVVIKKHDDNIGREYNQKFYYYSNKLALFKYGILFGIMLLEILVSFVLIQFVLKPTPTFSAVDKTIYILSVVFAAAFPIISACVYRFYYDARKRSNFNLKTSLAYRLIFMAQAILIFYALNLYFGMPISTSPEYYVSFIIPSVLSTNIPVATIIFNKLLKSGKFNVGA